MKKTIVLFSSFLLLFASVSAQNTRFGIKAGVSHNILSFKIDDDDDDYKIEGSNAGFFIGGLAHVQLSENFAIQPNLLFAMKGGALEAYKIKSMHIDLPVNFLYTNNGFFVGAGPNFSYGLSAKIDTEDEEIDMYDSDEAGSYTIKKFEIGANVLMGYTFPSGLSLSAHFSPGLNNIYEGDPDDDEDIVSHFKSFGFSVGYLFGGKGKK